MRRVGGHRVGARRRAVMSTGTTSRPVVELARVAGRPPEPETTRTSQPERGQRAGEVVRHVGRAAAREELARPILGSAAAGHGEPNRIAARLPSRDDGVQGTADPGHGTFTGQRCRSRMPRHGWPSPTSGPSDPRTCAACACGSTTAARRPCTWPGTTRRRRACGSRCVRGQTLSSWCLAHGIREALVGGFFTRPGLRAARGAADRRHPARAPSRSTSRGAAAARACTSSGAEVGIAARDALPARPTGDLLQAGPLLVTDGRAVYDRAEDREGFSAGSSQFDSDITAARHPRAALALIGDGRAGGGLRRPLACRRRPHARGARERPRRPRRPQRHQPRRRRLDLARRRRPPAQPPLRATRASRSAAAAPSRPRSSSSPA